MYIRQKDLKMQERQGITARMARLSIMAYSGLANAIRSIATSISSRSTHTVAYRQMMTRMKLHDWGMVTID